MPPVPAHVSERGRGALLSVFEPSLQQEQHRGTLLGCAVEGDTPSSQIVLTPSLQCSLDSSIPANELGEAAEWCGHSAHPSRQPTQGGSKSMLGSLCWLTSEQAHLISFMRKEPGGNKDQRENPETRDVEVVHRQGQAEVGKGFCSHL